MGLLVFVSALTVAISSMCSLFEAALYSTRMGALDQAARSSGRRRHLAQRLILMKSNIAEPTSAILILNTVANTAGATVCGMYAAQVLGVSWVPAFSAVLTVAVLFVGEILPKTYGATHWQSMWPLIVWPLGLMRTILKPFIVVTQAFATFFTGRHGSPAVTEGEIQGAIRLGRKAGELSASELQLLSAVFHFDETLTRQIMVPRREVEIVDVRWSLAQCLDIVKRTHHTRYPLCNGSLDQVVGLVHLKDLVGVTEGEEDLASVARPLRHVPETLPISRLLREMQSTHQHMVLVDDEYGTVVGLATLENVIEQLVGAVQDEFDIESPDIVPEEQGSYKVKGHLPIERINRELRLELSSRGVDSLSGLLVIETNRLLKVGDEVALPGATAEVLEAQAGRALVVRIRRTRHGESPASVEAEHADSTESG
jgi:CBS domain containing-hemolysin-like protein